MLLKIAGTDEQADVSWMDTASVDQLWSAPKVIGCIGSMLPTKIPIPFTSRLQSNEVAFELWTVNWYLINVWVSPEQSIFNEAIDLWRSRLYLCMGAREG